MTTKCQDKKKEQFARLVQEWQGKEIVFPQDMEFTRFVTDPVEYRIPDAEYKVLIYVDSTGCTSCKLQLPKWKELIAHVDSTTSTLNLIHTHEQRGEALDIPSLCASFSKAVSDMLVPRTMQALEQTGYRTLAIAGGVAANSRIRGEFTRRTQALGIRLCMPPLRLCGDNGAMIGAQGYYEYCSGKRAGQDLNAYATMSLENG